MPEYLPLASFRQGLLPTDCGSCSWWQTSGSAAERGDAAAHTRHDWAAVLDHEWGHPGLLVHEPAGRLSAARSGEVAISASIHFAPASSLVRFRELPFPPLPPLSALLFCLRADGGASRRLEKRLIRTALHELRTRGVQEVYAVAHWPEGSDQHGDCRFFGADLLAATGFAEVTHNGHLCLMKVDNRGLIAVIDRVQTAVSRIFTHEPAPSPAAWVRGGNGAKQGTP
jgi:hypothetical protein